MSAGLRKLAASRRSRGTAFVGDQGAFVEGRGIFWL